MTGDRTTVDLIEGKVAKLLNDRELVINRGSEHGVEVGTRFKIIERTENIRDPDTHDNLGSIEREKVRVKVVHVQPLLSIARTYETFSVPLPLQLALTSQAIGGSTSTRKVKTLRTSGAVDEEGAPVAIGDMVIQLSENEE